MKHGWVHLNKYRTIYVSTSSFEEATHIRGVEILKYSTCPQASYLKKVTCPVFFGFGFLLTFDMLTQTSLSK